MFYVFAITSSVHLLSLWSFFWFSLFRPSYITDASKFSANKHMYCHGRRKDFSGEGPIVDFPLVAKNIFAGG